MATSPDYENDAFEIARRVMKSYSGEDHEPPDDLVTDLAKRIYNAASDIANERIDRDIKDVFDIPSSPGPFPYYPQRVVGGDYGS